MALSTIFKEESTCQAATRPTIKLSQWERTDQVKMEDFNADNAKIDAALKAEADARTAAVAGLTQSRNCQLYYTTYVGTGTFGESAPNRLTFPHKPVFVHVAGDRLQCFSAVRNNPYAPDVHAAGSSLMLHLTWSGNILSWYIANGAGRQFNEKDVTYYVCAVLALED